MKSIEIKILSRIYGKGRGWCFTPREFLDLGARRSIDSALSRLNANGAIRRLSRGLYDYPKKHPELGHLSPSPEAVAKALAARDAIRIQPSGAYAANLLGLTEQVPAKIVFLTDGPSRGVKIGHQEILLKTTTPRNMATAGRMSGTVIQALRHLGPKQVLRHHIMILENKLTDEHKAQLVKDTAYAPGWMHPILAAIARSVDA